MFDRSEFGAFYAPDESHNQMMHGLLVDEYIDDRDTNRDTYLSFEEFICGFYILYTLCMIIVM